jgi:hypothetical protein
MSFVVPADAPVGKTALYVVNSNGTGALIPFEVLPATTPTDTDTDTDTEADTDTDTTP